MGRARPSGDECYLATIGAISRRIIVSTSADGDFFRKAGVESCKNQIGAVPVPLRVKNRISTGLIDRRDVETSANLTHSACPTRAHVELLHLCAGVAQDGEDHRTTSRGPRRRQRTATSRNCARLCPIAVDDLQLAVVDVRDPSLRHTALAEHPLLYHVRHPVQGETPIAVAPVEEKVLRLKQLSSRDIVRCHVQPLSSRRHPNEKRCSELSDERKVDLLARWRLEAAERSSIQR